MTRKIGAILQNKFILALIFGLTVAYWLILIFEIQLSKIIRGYFWHSMHNYEIELPLFWLIFPLIILAGVAIIFIFRSSVNYGWQILILIVLGCVMQQSFGYMEGRGINGIRDRMVTAGHAEFARLAAQNGDIKSVAVHYEDLLKSTDSVKYVHTKPPGQLLSYMLTQKISNIFYPVSGSQAKYQRLTTFAGYLLPLISYIVLIPLFYFTRLLADKELAIRACLLYVFIPSVTLTTLHMDQVLYPAIAMSCLLIAAYACLRSRLVYSIICGACLYLALFISFSLLPLILLTILVIIIFCNFSEKKETRLLKSLKIIGGLIIGMLIMYAIGRIVLSYDPWIRFSNAMLFHEEWKKWAPGFGNKMLYSLLNIIEYACWLGIPVALLFASGVISSIREAAREKPSIPGLLCLSLAIVILITSIFGKTKGEVARIWIFFMPLTCLFAVYSLQRLFGSKTNHILGVLLGLQMITIFIIKKYQDFY